MVRRASLSLLLLVVSGCAPQNAELTSGEFAVFLSHQTSLTVQHGTADLTATSGHWAVDCRELAEGSERLEGSLDVCSEDAWPPVHEAWLSRDAYHVQTEALDPWRGEAILTSEGDLQVTFHHQVTGGDDMRFAFVIDPAFQPRTCVQDASGEGTSYQDVDGDWLSSWSDPSYTTLDDTGTIGGTLFLLNARSYQFDPADLEDVWSLPLQWQAGFADARFGDENFVMRSTRYGEPSFYTSYESEEASEPSRDDLFYVTLPEESDASTQQGFIDLCDHVNGVADEVEAELGLVGYPVKPVVHCNGWRPTDGRPSGLDAWVELHYNWVRIDQDPSTIAVGEPVSGEFSLVFDGEQTQSRLFVHGAFTVDKVKKDHWVTDDIESIKLEENGTILCGE